MGACSGHYGINIPVVQLYACTIKHILNSTVVKKTVPRILTKYKISCGMIPARKQLTLHAMWHFADNLEIES